MIVDYAFAPYIPPHERRRRAAIRDGLAHIAEITPRDPQPNEPVTLHFWTNGSLPIDRVAVYYTVNGAMPSGERGHANQGTVALANPVGSHYDGVLRRVVRRWEAQLPGSPDGTLIRYRADAWSVRSPQTHWYADAVDPINANQPLGGLFAYHVDTRQPPAWFRDAIIYQIFVDRFATAADEPGIRDPGSLGEFFGGTLWGVLEQLDWIVDLGVTTIWLSPVFDSPTYHGYNPTSYAEVSPHYGGNAALRAVIAGAHARGLRVMLDFVANHTSDEHPRFKAAMADPKGRAGEWYVVDGTLPYGYHAFAHVKNMPELNTESPPVREYLIDAARSWLGDFGADALRLDMVSGPSHAFWTMFQEGIKQVFPAAVTLGEITAVTSEVPTYAGRLDAYMDFPLAKLLRQTFAQRAISLNRFLEKLVEGDAGLSPTMARAALLDNHDMHRFLWLAENDIVRLRLAAACLLTLDATPIIYYGTEVGVSQRAGPFGQDSYAREPMRWGAEQDTELREWFATLIRLRRDLPVLRHGTLARVECTVLAGDSEDVGGYWRRDSTTAVAVVFNLGDQPARVALSGSAKSLQTLHMILTLPTSCEIVTVEGVVQIDLAPGGIVVLRGESRES